MYIDFLLIRASGAVLRIRAKSSAREILAASAGSAFSLVLLLPRLSAPALFAVRAVTAAAVMLIAFGYSGRMNLVKRTAVFFAVSLCFSGVCFFLAENVNSNLAICRNGGVYLNISVWVLLVSTALAYSGICLFRMFTESAPEGHFTVTVRSADGKTASFPAMTDSGNSLADVITGIPVIVCSRERLKGAYDFIPSGTDDLTRGWRLIPYRTAGNSGLIPIIRPEEIIIQDAETGKSVSADAYIGIAEVKMETAIMNPVLLRDMGGRNSLPAIIRK